MNRSNQSLLEKFEQRVNRDGPNASNPSNCWKWTGSVHHMTGYGIFTVDKKSKSAHILSWELLRGAIPVGMWVRHKCGDKLCVNPDHLYLGDRRKNKGEQNILTLPGGV